MPKTNEEKKKYRKEKQFASDRRAAPKKGFIYVVSNPAWTEWSKIGLCTQAPTSRLLNYQTMSPLRDYKMEKYLPVDDVRKGEAKMFDILVEAGYEKQHEWFKIKPADACNLLYVLREALLK